MARLRKSVRRSRKPKMVLECKVKSKSRSLMKKSMKIRRSKSKRRRSKKRKSRSRRRKADGGATGPARKSRDSKMDGAPRRRP